MPQIVYKLHHKTQVMDGGQARVEVVVDFEQMMQVADGVMLAGVAITEGRKRLVSFDQFVIVDVEEMEPVATQGLGRVCGEAP